MIDFTSQEFQSLSSFGYMFMRMGKNDEAEKTFLAILQLATTQKQKKWLYKNLAFIYMRKKDYKSALNFLRQSIEGQVLKTEDAFLYLLRAEALWQMSRYQEAENSLKQYHNLISKNYEHNI